MFSILFVSGTVFFFLFMPHGITEFLNCPKCRLPAATLIYRLQRKKSWGRGRIPHQKGGKQKQRNCAAKIILLLSSFGRATLCFRCSCALTGPAYVLDRQKQQQNEKGEEINNNSNKKKKKKCEKNKRARTTTQPAAISVPALEVEKFICDAKTLCKPNFSISVRE